MLPSEPKSIYLAGPTASGKSAVALELAERLNGEIITVDSMQVYRGLDIGTAKPSPEEQARVPHHLIDVTEIDESFDAARFVMLAKASEAAIRARGRRPIFCGGTGLYFNALLGGLPEVAPADPKMRAEMEAMSMADLLEELRARDPVAFTRMDRSNPRRVVRALEILRSTGRPLAEALPVWSGEQPGLWFGLERDRADLVRRIDERVEAMFERGLVRETVGLLERGLRHNRTALQAIGYRQVVEHLEGARTLADTVEWVKIKTRQYAKRQMTWFRRQLKLRWVQAPSGDSAGAIAQQIQAWSS